MADDTKEAHLLAGLPKNTEAHPVRVVGARRNAREKCCSGSCPG